jgi:CheY-like chemotaxis protein
MRPALRTGKQRCRTTWHESAHSARPETTVESCAAAREVLASDRFDVVVLDVMLPDGSGIELYSQLRQSQVDVPILLLTAKGEVKSRVLGFFLPFFRARPAPGAPGFGLGLPLARAVARAHGGDVTVGSGRTDETEMLLRLPVVVWHQAQAQLE